VWGVSQAGLRVKNVPLQCSHRIIAGVLANITFKCTGNSLMVTKDLEN